MSEEPPKELKRVHFTELTDTLFDALSEKGISSAGQAIVYYLLRHTAGWQQRWVALSLDEFMHGRKKTSGARYDHGTPLKSPHTVYAAIEEVGLAGFILELDTHDSLGTKSYSIQACWLEQDRARLAQLEPTTTYQCVVSDGEIRMVEPQKPPVYQGITRGKPRKPRSEKSMQKLHRSKKDTPITSAKTAQVDEQPLQKLHNHLGKNYKGTHAKIAQVPPAETRREEGPREGDNQSIATSITKKLIDMPPSAGADTPLFDQKEEEQEEQPDLVTLRTEYATLSQQLEQLDARKQAGQWARLYKQVQAAEARLRQAEQDDFAIPRLSHQSTPNNNQSTPSSKRDRPTEEKRLCHRLRRQKQTSDKRSCAPLRATCSTGRAG